MAVAGAAFAVVLPAAPAAAHAELVESQPANGAVVAQAPRVALLRFSEDVSARFSSASLVDRAGHPVAGARIVPDRAGPRVVALDLPALAPGPYGIVWRAFTEDDGHTTSGVVVFTVGTAADSGGLGVLPTHEPATGARPPDVVRRWLGLCAIAVLIGGLAVAGVVLRRGRFGGSDGPWADEPDGAAVDEARRRVLTVAAAAGCVAAAIGVADLVAQGQRSASSLVDLMGGTRWGHLWLAGEALLVALAVVAVALRSPVRRRFDRAGWAAAAVLVSATVAVEALGSHAMAVRPARTAAVVAVAVHTLTACLWLGGVAAFAVAMARSGPPGSARTAVLKAFRARFTALAAASVGLVVATGLYSAGREIGPARAVVDTPYGRTLLVKGALLVVVGGLGLATAGWLRRRTRTEGDTSGWRRLLVAEVGAGLVLLLLVGVLVETAPPRDSPPRAAPPSAGVTRTGAVADLVVALSVTPNRPGANAFTVVAASGRRPPPAPVDEVTLELGGSPTGVVLRELEPGRYLGTAELGASGPLRATAVVHRAGTRLRVPVEWTVAPAAPEAAPTEPGARLASVTDGPAAILLGVLVLVGLWCLFVWRPGRRDAAALVVATGEPARVEQGVNS